MGKAVVGRWVGWRRGPGPAGGSRLCRVGKVEEVGEWLGLCPTAVRLTYVHTREQRIVSFVREKGGNKRNERMGIISIVTEPDEGECDMERIETKQMFHFDIEQGSLK
jgi:hypothetical protein